MAVATEYEIDFSCGHTETRDLSYKPAGDRQGLANWLSKKGTCSECFKKQKGKEDLEERMQEVTAGKQRLELPDLGGSEKQVKWGELNRDKLIRAAHEELTEGDAPEMTEDEFEARILVHARRINRAGWWMDNKDAEVEDLEELVSTALDDGDAQAGTENPY